jgi:hypothetical protein
MAMTYSDAQISIEQNNWFRGRVRNATSIYANYLLNTPVEDPDYDSKIQGGTRIAQQADMVVNQLMFTLAGDSEVLTAGPAIPDTQLQQIVEKTIIKFHPIPVTPAGMTPMQMRYLPPRPAPVQ